MDVRDDAGRLRPYPSTELNGDATTPQSTQQPAPGESDLDAAVFRGGSETPPHVPPSGRIAGADDPPRGRGRSRTHRAMAHVIAPHPPEGAGEPEPDADQEALPTIEDVRGIFKDYPPAPSEGHRRETQ